MKSGVTRSLLLIAAIAFPVLAYGAAHFLSVYFPPFPIATSYVILAVGLVAGLVAFIGVFRSPGARAVAGVAYFGGGAVSFLLEAYILGCRFYSACP